MKIKRILIAIFLLGILVGLTGCDSYKSCYEDCVTLEVEHSDDCRFSFGWGCESKESEYRIQEKCNKRCAE